MSWRNRKKYPKNWEELSLACRERANWCCEQCGIVQGTDRAKKRGKRFYQVTLQAAHLDRDPWNPNPRLIALCQDCHFKFDRIDNGQDARRARLRNIYRAMLCAGQLRLFIEEIQ